MAWERADRDREAGCGVDRHVDSRYSNSIGHRVRLGAMLGAALEGCLAVAPLDPLRGVVLGAWPAEARSRLELDLG